MDGKERNRPMTASYRLSLDCLCDLCVSAVSFYRFALPLISRFRDERIIGSLLAYT
jgi:hypothetical protein